MAFKPGCSECGSFAINHQCHGRDGSDGHLCDVCYWRKRAEVKQANAALIAAAPELLDMLEKCYESEWGYGLGPTHDEMVALIAKAKGGKS